MTNPLLELKALGQPEAYFSHVYWRVQAIDAHNVQGPWSAIGNFTITTPYNP